MSFEPFMWATFCDDIRQEAGNKLSYMGIYGSNLVVPSFPATLVKLCCVLTVKAPANSPPKQVIFKLLRDDETIFEGDLSGIDVSNSTSGLQANEIESRAFVTSTVAQFLSFQITQRCFLRARAIVDGKELRGGALELLAADAQS